MCVGLSSGTRLRLPQYVCIPTLNSCYANGVPNWEAIASVGVTTIGLRISFVSSPAYSLAITARDYADPLYVLMVPETLKNCITILIRENGSTMPWIARSC